MKIKNSLKYVLLLLFIVFQSCKKDEDIKVETYYSPEDDARFEIDKTFINSAQFENANTVFSNPIISFFHKLDDTIYAKSGLTYKIKPFLDKITVTSNARAIPVELVWNKKNDTVKVILKEKLDVNAKCKVEVVSHWLWKNINNTYIDYKKKKEIVYEKKEFTFNSGTSSPDTIPAINIKHSLPINKQYHFFKSESTTGFINFNASEEEMFNTNISGISYSYLARFYDGTNSIDKICNYEKTGNKITFEIPQSLQNEKIYSLSIIRKSSNSEKILHKLHFRTSKYDNSIDKINALAVSGTFSWQVYPPVDDININLTGGEFFDSFEAKFSKVNNYCFDNVGMIDIELDTANSWIRGLKLSHYNHVEGSSVKLKWREKTSYGGLVPTKNIIISQNIVPELSNQEISSFTSLNHTITSSIILKTEHVAYQDFSELQNEILNTPNKASWMSKVLSSFFTPMSSGAYNLILTYKSTLGEVKANRKITFNIQ